MHLGDHQNPVVLDCYADTISGSVRESHRDQFFVGDLQRSFLLHHSSIQPAESDCISREALAQLLVVADGLGTEEVAAHASAEALEQFARQVLSLAPASRSTALKQLATAMGRTQECLRQKMPEEASRKAFGTTLTAAMIIWPDVYIVHAGDARVYHYHGRKLRRLTTDHTLGARSTQQPSHATTASGANQSPWRNVLWNALTADERDVSPESVQEELCLGDALVLCTKGLGQFLDEQDVQSILRRDRTGRETCKLLIQQAREQGAREDASVIVARFRSPARWDQLQEEEIQVQCPNDSVCE